MDYANAYCIPAHQTVNYCILELDTLQQNFSPVTTMLLIFQLNYNNNVVKLMNKDEILPIRAKSLKYLNATDNVI